MRFEVELSGLSIRHGRIQIRFCLYLDPDDYGYEKHFVDVPIEPLEGYSGFGENGQPIDNDHYNEWLDSLPTVKRINPFHNHFIQVDPDITDEEILFLGEWTLLTAKRKWDKDEFPGFKNQPFKRIANPTNKRLNDCSERAAKILSKELKKDNVVDEWVQ